MNKTGTQRLETERLILRPFVMEDAEDMYRNWASDPESRSEVCCLIRPAMCCTLWGVAPELCFRYVSSSCIKPLISLSMTPGSFFGLEAVQKQVLQPV